MKIISGSSIIILFGSLTMFAQSPMPPPPYGDYHLNAGFSPIHLGVIRDLGDAPLENLTLDDPRVEFLSVYQAPRTLETAQAEAARFRQGVQLDGAIYRSEVPNPGKLNVSTALDPFHSWIRCAGRLSCAAQRR